VRGLHKLFLLKENLKATYKLEQTLSTEEELNNAEKNK
jgi:hypothetical protein